MLKTLIVEDSALFRQTFKEALCTRFPSMVIEAVADGSEVGEKITTFMPDLVFMDVRLSGESGLELTKRIKASHPKIIVIILTHYDVPEYREAAHEVGADGFIIKESLDLSEIAALVGSLVSDGRKGSIVHETKT